MSKTGAKSRRKGKSGELQVCRLLEKGIYPDGQGSVRRTPQSGAWGGLTVMTGDAVFIREDKIDERVPFFIEIKRYKYGILPYLKMFEGDTGKLGNWLEEAKEKAGRLFSVVLWKEDYSDWRAAMLSSGFEFLCDEFLVSIPVPFFYFGSDGRYCAFSMNNFIKMVCKVMSTHDDLKGADNESGKQDG